VEILLADGGSNDRTREIAAEHGISIVTSRRGRGAQLNEGARNATGDTLLFLHCDTILPSDFHQQVSKVLSMPGTAAGAFLLRIDTTGTGYRIIEWGVNFRSRLMGLPYGDQGLFVSREVFAQAGGFPELPFLEDLELVRRLRRIGRVRLAPAAVTTSSRRWERLGLFRTTLTNQLILAAYLCRCRPETLRRFYYGITARQNRS